MTVISTIIGVMALLLHITSHLAGFIHKDDKLIGALCGLGAAIYLIAAAVAFK